MLFIASLMALNLEQRNLLLASDMLPLDAFVEDGLQKGQVSESGVMYSIPKIVINILIWPLWLSVYQLSS